MINTKTCYALKHGYQFFVETNILQHDKNIFWNKQRVCLYLSVRSLLRTDSLVHVGCCQVFAFFRLGALD
jgi:hypothetical protein